MTLLLDGVASAPNGGLPAFVISQEQVSPTREPDYLEQSQGNSNVSRAFFPSMKACPSFPDWQP
jgi:hypothetical protein